MTTLTPVALSGLAVRVWEGSLTRRFTSGVDIRVCTILVQVRQ